MDENLKNELGVDSNGFCKCPFHFDSDKSMMIDETLNSFICLRCGQSGDIPTLLSLMGKKKLEKIELSDNSKIYELNNLVCEYFERGLQYSNEPRDYIYKKRVLSDETVKKFRLGYANQDWTSVVQYLTNKGFSEDEIISAGVGFRSQKTGKVYDFFRNRVMFPIIDIHNRVIGFGGRVMDDSKPKYINTNETAVFSKRENIFSFNNCDKNNKLPYIILAEGYMDVIALNQAGINNAVATLGTALTFIQAQIIASLSDVVVVAYDGDKAGITASEKANELFKYCGVKTVRLKLGSDVKDPDEYLRKYGADSLTELIRKTIG